MYVNIPKFISLVTHAFANIPWNSLNFEVSKVSRFSLIMILAIPLADFPIRIFVYFIYRVTLFSSSSNFLSSNMYLRMRSSFYDCWLGLWTNVQCYFECHYSDFEAGDEYDVLESGETLHFYESWSSRSPWKEKVLVALL